MIFFMHEQNIDEKSGKRRVCDVAETIGIHYCLTVQLNILSVNNKSI